MLRGNISENARALVAEVRRLEEKLIAANERTDGLTEALISVKTETNPEKLFGPGKMFEVECVGCKLEWKKKGEEYHLDLHVLFPKEMQRER